MPYRRAGHLLTLCCTATLLFVGTSSFAQAPPPPSPDEVSEGEEAGESDEEAAEDDEAEEDEGAEETPAGGESGDNQEEASKAPKPGENVPETDAQGVVDIPPPPAQVRDDSSGTEADAEAWELYHRAFKFWVDKNRQGSINILRRLVREHPNHPTGKNARLILQTAGVSLTPPPPGEEEPDTREREETTAVSRAELVIFQTLHGVGVGGEFCIIAECEEARAVVASLIVGGGLGLGGSLLLTTDGITPGETNAIDSGVIWGFWNGLAIASTADLQEREFTATLLTGQLAGLGAGILAYNIFEPLSGDVSLANSAGIWAGIITLFAHGVGRFEAEEEIIWLSLMAISDLGFVAGAIASQEYPMTRGRSLVIDSGGIVGALVGIGIPVLIMNEDVEPEPVFLSGIAGTIGGLTLATYLTRNWDLPEAAVDRVGIAPTMDGGMTLTIGGDF